ncbi:hypothetical protein J4434_01385 [Candidatus Woesearchaeota archaeon]|nr:hypothetical protein [Candidatus Woesearchaeota archaeon]
MQTRDKIKHSIDVCFGLAQGYFCIATGKLAFDVLNSHDALQSSYADSLDIAAARMILTFAPMARLVKLVTPDYKGIMGDCIALVAMSSAAALGSGVIFYESFKDLAEHPDAFHTSRCLFDFGFTLWNGYLAGDIVYKHLRNPPTDGTNGSGSIKNGSVEPETKYNPKKGAEPTTTHYESTIHNPLSLTDRIKDVKTKTKDLVDRLTNSDTITYLNKSAAVLY